MRTRAVGRAFSDAVYRLVRTIPAGRVATYGQLASLLGRPRAARAVGGAMRHCPADLPWHRVLNAAGRISRRARVAGMLTQRIRLEQEGITVRGGRVALRRYRWRIDDAASSSSSGSRSQRGTRREARFVPELLSVIADPGSRPSGATAPRRQT